MQAYSFLKTVRQNGGYPSVGEATRAANAVMGTMKGYLSPVAADKLRQSLPQDVSRLWQYSPAACITGLLQERLRERPGRGLHFILQVQQIGKYYSSQDAQRAACSVLATLAGVPAADSAGLIGQVLPPEIMGACRLSSVSRAA